MCGVKIKSVPSVKDLGVTVASNLKVSQQYESVKKANRIRGLIDRNLSSKNKTLLLYNSYVRPRLEYGRHVFSVEQPR